MDNIEIDKMLLDFRIKIKNQVPDSKSSSSPILIFFILSSSSPTINKKLIFGMYV
jgi:hypothetical protein